MAVISPHTAPNFVFGQYFKILRWTVETPPGDLNPRLVLYVGFWVSDYARKQAPQAPAYTYPLTLPISVLMDMGYADPRDEMYELLLKTMFNGLNASPDFTVQDQVKASTLGQSQMRKKAEISAAKYRANKSFFVFRGAKFQAGDDAMLQIQTTMNGILGRGGKLRDDWNGAWLDINNNPFPIPDVETWYSFYAAIEETGQRNFDHSRALKMLVDQCTTMNQVAAINWDIDLTTFQLPEPVADPEEGTEDPVPSTNTLPELEPPPPTPNIPVSQPKEPEPDPVPEPAPEPEPEPTPSESNASHGELLVPPPQPIGEPDSLP